MSQASVLRYLLVNCSVKDLGNGLSGEVKKFYYDAPLSRIIRAMKNSRRTVEAKPQDNKMAQI